MPRRPTCKRVEGLPGVDYFHPGTEGAFRGEILLSVEELEALRLAHLEGLYQQEAAERMGVSRATFGRVVDAAHRKVTQALVEGWALRIQGGSFCMIGPERCSRCPGKGALAPGEPSPCDRCPDRAPAGGTPPP